MRNQALKLLSRSLTSTLHNHQALSSGFPSCLPPPQSLTTQSHTISHQCFITPNIYHHHHPQNRFFASSTTQSSSPHILYKGRGIRIFRVLVRLKIFQLTGIAALAVPITTFFSTGSIGLMQGTIASALVIGSGAASWALYYYSKRYVGELSIINNNNNNSNDNNNNTSINTNTVVRFSVLDFWGNRENIDIPLHTIIPPFKGLSPSAMKHAASEPAFPLCVDGGRQFVLSLRYGHVVDGEMLKKLLDGTLID